MSNFNEFSRYISKNFTIDYWEDNAITYAKQLISKFRTEDWEILESNWIKKPSHWRNYCAQVLSSGAPKFAVRILLDMINNLDDELTISAADSLRSMDINFADLIISSSILERLKQIRNKDSKITTLIITDLLNKLSISHVIPVENK
ncbi:MAG: hypothetical protein U1E82_07205 [Nitrosomonas sp.]|nr:hypothetical protein [Nitrosomonas sp.]